MNDLSWIIKEFGALDRYQVCPPCWIPKPKQAMPLIDQLKQATVRNLGQSAGGRTIISLEYGQREPLQTITDNLHSALASKLVPPDPTDIFPASFYGKNRRKKPVVVLQGGIHGGELTGTVASLNLCNVIETGNDLKGKAWPVLRELAKQTRLLIIPWLNRDGVERWPLDNPSGAPGDLYSRCTGGVRSDGSPYLYPAFKEFFPIPVEQTAFMGSYFNDGGYNLQYDFCSVERQPETIAWMKYYLDERPDAVVAWHCNAGSLMGPAEYYLPQGHQHLHSRLSGAVYRRLTLEKLPASRMSWAQLPGMGKPYIEQSTAIYHACGATPLMCELPYGAQPAALSCEAMVDQGLMVIEEILNFAHTEGLRPYEYREKIKSQL